MELMMRNVNKARPTKSGVEALFELQRTFAIRIQTASYTIATIAIGILIEHI